MSSKFNNKHLLIAFGALILLFLFVKFYKSARSERTLKTDIVQIDTTAVTKILLYPESDRGQEVVFIKEGKEWKVTNGKISAETEKDVVKSVVAQLATLKAKGLVARTKDKWAEYKVNDTTATRVKIYEGSKEKLNIYIGKFTYQQTKDPYGQGGVIGTSYVRLADEDEVYAVEGFLTFSVNLPFNKWRNQTLTRFNTSDVSKLTFRYPGDSSFVAELKDKKWTVNNQVVDSVNFANYLSTLSRKNASVFDDNFSPVGNSQYQLTIEGKNMSNITVDAFEKAKDVFAINSSVNSKSWFLSDSKGFFMEVFKGKKFFTKTKGKK